MNDVRHVLEVCIASVQDARAAVAGGADRLELNAALELGGLTPSPGLFEEVKQAVDVPVIVMLRPRGAGFRYNDAELRVMRHDAQWFVEHGADGIAFGALDARGQVDRNMCRQLIECAGEREIVFHRAFDLVADPHEAMNVLVDLGVTRVMTSGQADSAVEGIELIANLQCTFGDRIEILPASGVRGENVKLLLERTGCRQLHGSFRTYRHDVAMPVADGRFGVTDHTLVAAARREMQDRPKN